MSEAQAPRALKLDPETGELVPAFVSVPAAKVLAAGMLRDDKQSVIPRKQTTDKGFKEWLRSIPKRVDFESHKKRVIAGAPDGWQKTIDRRFGWKELPPLVAQNLKNFSVAEQMEALATLPTDSDQAWTLLQSLATFEDEYGRAIDWNLSDSDIRDLAAKLSDYMRVKTQGSRAQQKSLPERLDEVRQFIRKVGVNEETAIKGEPDIARACDPKWWRRRIRTKVIRTVEAGAISLGLVHAGRGMYVSNDALKRRRAQLDRNAQALEKTLMRNEAGQVYTLAELAALGTANPVIRGGELMTRIRGAEEYADSRAHVGLFVTLTLPSRFHPVTKGGRGKVRVNPKYVPGTTPRDGQMWLRDKWAKVRAKLARKGIKIYGLRVAEPHHDATPHWHMLVWTADEASAQAFEGITRSYWLSDDGDERGAAENRVNFKRMECGGAAGYVAKYIAKSVGHVALAEHMDVVDGEQYRLAFGEVTAAEAANEHWPNEAKGHERVDAWAAHWGIRQFQTIGMPSVTIWRELRRVTPDQLELFEDRNDRTTLRAWRACHRQGDIKADWRQYMEAMGGHALPRGQWYLAPAKFTPEPGDQNQYGEEIKPTQGRILGVQPQRGCMRGHWLVSRRIAWTAVAPEAVALEAAVAEVKEAARLRAAQEDGRLNEELDKMAIEHDRAAQAAQQRREAMNRRALPDAWTGFNNCTARLTGGLKVGITDHDISAWNPDSARIRPFLEACY